MGRPGGNARGERTGMLRRIYNKLAGVWYRLVTLKSSPRKIALGLALGVFLSYTPTIGFQTPIAIGLAALLKVNPVSAVIGVYLTNVFTAWPLYLFCYKVGGLVLGVEVTGREHVREAGFLVGVVNFGRLGLEWMAVELLGAIIVGSVSAVAAYFLALFALIRYRRARLRRRIQKMRERL